MGIQLDHFDKLLIRRIADDRERGDSMYAYLFGYLGSAIDLFLAGKSEKRDLEATWASLKLGVSLSDRLDPAELRQIADGTREVPGDEVQSGR